MFIFLLKLYAEGEKEESNKLFHLFSNEGTRGVCFSAISSSMNKITD